MPYETGAIEATRGTLPGPVVEAFVPLTDLGDPLFVVLLVAAVYWLGEHRRGTVLVAATLCVLGLVVGLKQLFGLPRPPADLALVAVGGFGLPSGHAAGAVVVYGSLAALYDVGDRRLRYAAAAVLAGLVALSRVVIGVHYLADVLAGVVLGLVVLAVVVRVADRPAAPPALLVAGGLGALVAALLSGLAYDSALLVLGGAVGALVSWRLAARPPHVSLRARATGGAVALPVVVGLVAVGRSVLSSPLALLAATAAAMAVVLLTPHAAARAAALAASRRTSPGTDTLY